MSNFVDVNNTAAGVKNLLDKQNRSGKAIDTDIGNKDDLVTSHKNSIVDAINELAGGTNYRIFETTDARDANYPKTEDIVEGTLAYITTDQLMYQWRLKGDDKIGEWVVFSSGTGGGSAAATIELVNADNIPKTIPVTQTSISYQVKLSNVTTGSIVTTYNFSGKSANTIAMPVTEAGTYTIVIDKDLAGTGSLHISTKFVSSDSTIKSPLNPVSFDIYKGEMLNVSDLGINGAKRGTYSILNNTYDSVTVGSDLSGNLILGGSIQCADAEQLYSATLTLTRLDVAGKSHTVKVSSLSGKSVPLSNEDFQMSYAALEETFGSLYGMYTLSISTVTTTNIYGNVATCNFVIDSNVSPRIFLLHYSEISVRNDATLNYAILYNGGARYNGQNYSVVVTIADSDNAERVATDTIEDITTKLSLSINRDAFITAGLAQDKVYDITLSLVDPETVSNSCKIKYIELDSFTYSTREAVFLLDSSRNITRNSWNSYVVTYNKSGKANKYSNDSVTFHNLATTVRNGLNIADVGDNESKQVVCFDGQSSYGTIPLNLFKTSTDGEFNTDSGFTFEIRFKAKQQYTGGSVLECLTPAGYGFRITPNTASISLKMDVNSVNDKTSVAFTRLTSDVWHTVSFVLLPASSSTGSDYVDYMYNHSWISTNITACLFMYVDGVLSGMAPVNDKISWDGVSAYTKAVLGASYNYTANMPDDFVKMQLSHLRLYNTALSSDEILTNYICDQANEDKRDKLKELNGWNGTSFGNNLTLMPELVFTNANLAELDAKQKTDAKSWVYPNVTVELYNRAVQDTPILKRYGCEVKVQGTSSCDYAVKNYKVTFYGFTEELLFGKEGDDTSNGILTDAQKTFVKKYNMLPDELVFAAPTSGYTSNTGQVLSKSTKRLKISDVLTSLQDGVSADTEWNSKDKKVSVNGWLPDATYTLKADYMESSHAHNTGTAKYVNTIMPKVPPMKSGSLYDESDTITRDEDGNITDGGQKVTDLAGNTIRINPIDQVRNAIDGFPMVMTYVYHTASNEAELFENVAVGGGKILNSTKITKGVYNFNIDKNAEYVFGYDRYNDEDRLDAGGNLYYEGSNDKGDVRGIRDAEGNLKITRYDCKSYEISGNTVVDDDENLKQSAAMFYVNLLGDDSTSNDAKIAVATDIELRYHPDEDSALYENVNGEELLRTGATHTNDSDTRNDALSAEELKYDGPNGEIMHLLNWLWDVAHNDDDSGRQLSQADIRKEFEQHFDIDNLTMYLLVMRVMGMTDNLAKNMMITTWNASDEHVVYKCDENGKRVAIDYDNSTFCKWYLQFYDMDTMLGLSNTGLNIYDTSIDIKAHEYREMYCGESMQELVGTQSIKDAFPDIERTSYSGGASKLWDMFNQYYGQVLYGSASSESQYVREKYATYRTSPIPSIGYNILSHEAIMYFLGNLQIDKIGQYYYNLDMKTKYLGVSFISASVGAEYFYMCNGSRRAFIEDWLADRIRYIDSRYLNLNSTFNIRPNVSSNTNLILSANAVAPVYLMGQANDKNDSTPFTQLFTSKSVNYLRDIDSAGNRVPIVLSADGTFNLSGVEFLSSASGLYAFSQENYNLNSFTSLTEINFVGDNNVKSIAIGSKNIVNLYLNNANNLTSLALPSDSTDIYSVDVSNTSLISMPDSLASAACINISGSKLTSYDFSKFNQLEAVNKVKLGSTAGYADYNSVISTLKTYCLISGTSSADDLSYIDRLVADARKSLAKAQAVSADGYTVLAALDDSLSDNATSADQLKKIIDGSATHSYGGSTIQITFKNYLEPQYIYGLVLVQYSGTGNADVSNIKFNSPYIKAIVLNNTSTNKLGQEAIEITCSNLQYLYMNKLGGTSITANCANLRNVTISECSCEGIVDLSYVSKLETLSCRHSRYITQIILSDELQTSNTLTKIDLCDCRGITCVRMKSDADADNYINLHNIQLNQLDLFNVYQVSSITGLNLVCNTGNLAETMRLRCGGAVVTTLYQDYYAKNKLCTLSGTITITANTSMAYMFAGRCNMVFDNLNWRGLNKVTSLQNSFAGCNKLKFSDVTKILNNVSATLTNLEQTFACCCELDFPQISSAASPINAMKGRYYIPSDLFSKCTGVTIARGLFGSCDRYWGDKANKMPRRNPSLVNNIALPHSVLDSFTKLENAAGMFSDSHWVLIKDESTAITSLIGGEYTSSIDSDLLTYSDNNVANRSGFLGQRSYISSFYGDLFDKCTKITRFSDGLNYGPTDNPVISSIFNVGGSFSTANPFSLYCYTSCNETTRGVNSMFRTLDNPPWAGLFGKSCSIYEATEPGKSGTEAVIDKTIFKKADGSYRGSDTSTTYLCHMFAQSHVRVNLDGLFTTLRGNVYTTGMFYGYSGSELTLKPELFGYKETNDLGYTLKTTVKIIDTQQMFGKCTNLSGTFRNTVKRISPDSGREIEVVDLTDNNTCFTTQLDSLQNIANMFNGCANLGGDDYYLFKNDTLTSVTLSDFSPEILHGMVNLKSCRELFKGCTKLRFSLDDIYTKVNGIPKRIYMFEGLHNLKYVDGLFRGMTSLTGIIPDYNTIDTEKSLSFGSRMDDCKYFYYDITKRVEAVVSRWVQEQIATDATHVDHGLKEGMDYDVNSDGTITYRWNTIMTLSEFSKTFPITYRKVEADGTTHTFYEYYKGVTPAAFDDKNNPIKYLGVTADENNNHKLFLNTRGFLSTRESDDDAHEESIQSVTHLFDGCTLLRGGIPSNLLRGLYSINTISYLFYGCSSLGLTNDGIYSKTEAFRHPDNDTAVNLEDLNSVNPQDSDATLYKLTQPPYCYPFGLLDDLSALQNAQHSFHGVRYLGRPYCAKPYCYAIAYPEQCKANLSTAAGYEYDEVYVLPKYFFRFNANLENADYCFAADSYNAADINNMCGRLYPYMFANNAVLSSLRGTFKYTSIIGSMYIGPQDGDSLSSDNLRAFYIGAPLLQNNNKLSDISELFLGCGNLNWLNHPNASQGGAYILNGMLLDYNKPKALKTKNLISTSTATSAFGKQLTINTLGTDNQAGKLVLTADGTWGTAKECYEYFTAASSSDTLVRASADFNV